PRTRKLVFLTAVTIPATAVIRPVRGLCEISHGPFGSRAYPRVDCAVVHIAHKRPQMNNTFRRFAGALLALMVLASSAFAQTTETRRKVSADLQKVVYGAGISGLSWARDTSSGRMVKALVVAKPGVDPDLTALRSAV